MSEYTKRELEKICQELSEAIPNAPNWVIYGGVSTTSDMFVIHIQINWPRWYRHPDEYGGEDSPGLSKKFAIVSGWEDKVWDAIGKIEKKYGISVDMSAN